MKNPLHYQLSEYDCGPTSMLNAISFLFEREEIPPEILRNIMIYCLDSFNTDGIAGKAGTSEAAMMFLNNWLNGYGRTGQLPVSSRYLSGEEVFLGERSAVNEALYCKGAVVVRLFLEEPHYVLLTGAANGQVQAFDPYYIKEPFQEEGIQIVSNQPEKYNRLIPEYYFNSEQTGIYAFGPVEMREAVILFNENTKLTQESTVEYFI